MENNEITQGLHCDTTTGVCEVAETVSIGAANAQKPVKLLYFTDPICSSCWGIEPQMRKLKQEYGDYFDIEYRMGGLLKSWSEYGGSDVNGPESVAKHWEEAGAHYQMPINGEVWNADPLHSSYPPSIAFKAAQLQDSAKAALFLRRIKEMVFVERKNITKLEHLKQAAKEVGLDAATFERDYAEKAPLLFEEDLAVAKAWGVRGFPTIYFIDAEDNRFKVYGSKPYHVYEQALLKLLTAEVSKKTPATSEAIFEGFPTVTLKEYAVFYDVALDEAEAILHDLEAQGKVEAMTTEAGAIWKIKRQV
ncbi:MAG: DsbA family protein [Chitinophagaceae bacterium]|nr:MAG: DsbA family protein [Chitinophagaceae bacterium]